MFNSRKTESELEELVSIHEKGGGFGDPDAIAEHGRKIDFLKHKQIQEIRKSNNRMAVFNIVIAIINVAILIFQVFYK
ncbi:hypothetical protein [uncultured Microbulbifer sp.]|uniref:hypothetical protein n=1 Tax=uncultured Microbulbifer sp. TaxID=348147 RepID=UPI0026170C4A|nr:hypothetical protein [uncultured Microbulbifer sp.]